MPAADKQLKRPYLSKPDRRQALLDVAAELVETRGWPALTMISLADAAKVSRQLVYQHFASVNELMAQTITHLFRHSYETMRRHIANPELSLAELLRIAQEQTFNDRPERVRALWEMMILSDTRNDEAAKVSRRLRHLLIKLWAPPIQRHSGLSEKQSRAMAWMLNMAFWGAHQMVEEGEISRKAATELSTALLRQLDPPAGTNG